MDYPKQRNLDGVYYRVQRDGLWLNVCYSDMTPEERQKVKDAKPQAEYWQKMADAMADALRYIGDMLDLEGE